MKREPSPELQRLAADLFAAGRAEQPSAALGRRLQLLAPRPPGSEVLVVVRPETALHEAGSHDLSLHCVGSRGRIPRGSLLRWLSAAALLASAAGVWLWIGRDTGQIQLSPDRARSASRAALEVAAPEPVEKVLEAEGSEPTLEARPERRAPERRDPERRDPEHSAPLTARPTPTPRRRAPLLAPLPHAAAPVTLAPSAKALTLLEELELLKRARAALRAGDGAEALLLLERQARERSGSELEAEATLLRIEALAALERQPEASELASRFVRANPNSALGDRARSFIRGAAALP